MGSPKAFADLLSAGHKKVKQERDELRSMLATVLAGIDSGNLDEKTLEKARSLVEGRGE